LRRGEARDDAGERLPALLHLHELRVDAQAAAKATAAFLLLLGSGLPAKGSSNGDNLPRAVPPPGTEDRVYRYKLYEFDGTETDEAHYAVLIEPGEIIWTGDGRKLRVVDLLPTVEPGLPFVGLLRVEPAAKN
jgi:hypothetical protein